jgi:hypothetical protein
MDPETSPSLPEAVVIAQREVQRKLGRTLIRLQQYERLVKCLVAGSEIAGPVSQLDGIRTERHAEVSKKTLGQAIVDLTTSFVSPASSASDQDDQRVGDGTQVCVRTTFQWEMSEEARARMREDLTKLVASRNELVHHFLDRFDIWTETGCLAADAYLDDAYRQIDRQLEQLKQMAQEFDELRIHHLKMMQSQEFLDFLTSGRPGALWPSFDIIRLLQEAETTLARDGWTSLEEAIAFIQTREPGQNPRQYGCVSWRQVLHESKQFEIRRDRAPEPASRTRYRSHPRGTNG